MAITYGSVCSGIEAASVAWEPLGLSPAWFAQFDPEHDYNKVPDFPSAVLAHHWPHVPNLGDMTKIADMLRDGSAYAPDILVGGTPCQAFSVAGMRDDGICPTLTCNHEAPIGIYSVHVTHDPDTNTELAHPLGRNHGQENAVFAFAENSRQEVRLDGGDGQITGALSCGGGKAGQGYPTAMVGMAVRRLTPIECERLQGFPDGHTAIPYRNKPAADGHRYKALGNSMAVPVIAWLGKRIIKELTHGL